MSVLQGMEEADRQERFESSVRAEIIQIYSKLSELSQKIERMDSKKDAE